MDYNEFLKYYTIETLSSIDVNIHEVMLNKFISLQKEKKEFIFFDIGCNGGSFIKTIKNKGINAKIHAFEPHPYLFKYLTETYPNDKINCECVTNIDGKCNINIPLYSVGLSSIIKRPIFESLKTTQEIKSLECNAIRLDSYCKKNDIRQIDFIKIDVEGAEYFVFEGAQKLLSENKILCGQFEVGIEESGHTTNDILNMLIKYGYEVDKTLKSDYFFFLKNK
jgi:FkbM family methyltransferase